LHRTGASIVMKNKIDVFSKMVHYHENVHMYSDIIKNVLDLFEQKKYSEAFDLFSDFYFKEIHDHFRFEEIIVFPAIMTYEMNVTVHEAIKRLIEGHEVMLGLCGKIMSEKDRKEEFTDQIVQPITDYLEELRIAIGPHAELEEKLLFPMIQSDNRVRFLMGRAFVQFRSDYKDKYLSI
jgi:iron-sulfur cluster repair protein YtfE (RIC family)